MLQTYSSYFYIFRSHNKLLKGFPVPIARRLHPFPFRTRPLRVSAAMVLHNRVWESSAVPGFFFADIFFATKKI